MNNQDLKGINKGLITVLLVILGIFLVSLIVSTIVDIRNKIKEAEYIGQEIETKNTITVSNTGEVYVKPDLALATFSVKTEAKTVAKAMSHNTEKMNAIIDFMKKEGNEDKDLKTIAFNIQPRYEYRKAGVPPYPPGKRVLVGYEVTQSLQAKIRDMEKIGQIIEGATAAGANQVGDLQFTVDKQDELKKQAREQAIEKAKAKAKELASQLGVDLVRVTNFTESSVVPPYYGLRRFAEPATVAGEEIPEIETGENKIEVTVNITYEIK